MILACSDPPDPPRATDSPSVARWVEWRADDAPVSRPIALFVDSPGGALDRLAADPDVTTFLNDRFHPIFHPIDPTQPSGTVQLFTADGCAFGAPFAPASATQIIDAANVVIVRPEASGRSAPRFGRDCATPLRGQTR